MLCQLAAREQSPGDAETTPRLIFGCSSCLPDGEWDLMRVPRIFQSGYQPILHLQTEFHMFDALLCHEIPGVGRTLGIEFETREESDFRKATQFAAERVIELRTARILRNTAPAVQESVLDPSPPAVFSDEEFDNLMRTLE